MQQTKLGKRIFAQVRFQQSVPLGRLIHGKGGTIPIGMLCYMKELATGGTGKRTAVAA